MTKPITGEKYIYLAMAYQLCKQSQKKHVKIGNDSGMKGDQNFERCFSLLEQATPNRYTLRESKTDVHFVSRARYFLVEDEPGYSRPSIYEIVENGDNLSTHWQH